MKAFVISIAVCFICMSQAPGDAHAVLYNVTGDIGEEISHFNGKMDIELVYDLLGGEDVIAQIDIRSFKLRVEDYVFGGTGNILDFYGTDGRFVWNYNWWNNAQSWLLENQSYGISGSGDLLGMHGFIIGPAFFEKWEYGSQAEIMAITLPESFTIMANNCAVLFEEGWYKYDPRANFHFAKAPVPEPTSLVLMGVGCILMVGFCRMKRSLG